MAGGGGAAAAGDIGLPPIAPLEIPGAQQPDPLMEIVGDSAMPA